MRTGPHKFPSGGGAGHPLLGGEGWGEGERHSNLLFANLSTDRKQARENGHAPQQVSRFSKGASVPSAPLGRAGSPARWGQMRPTFGLPIKVDEGAIVSHGVSGGTHKGTRAANG